MITNEDMHDAALNLILLVFGSSHASRLEQTIESDTGSTAYM